MCRRDSHALSAFLWLLYVCQTLRTISALRVYTATSRFPSLPRVLSPVTLPAKTVTVTSTLVGRGRTGHSTARLAIFGGYLTHEWRASFLNETRRGEKFALAVLDMVETYQKSHGLAHLIPKFEYRIPENAEELGYPSGSGGYSLGRAVHEISKEGKFLNYPEVHQKAMALGIVPKEDQSLLHFNPTYILEAWEDFQAENGPHSIPPFNFIDVKHNHIPLGRIVHAILLRKLLFAPPWVAKWNKLMGRQWFSLIPKYSDLVVLNGVLAYKRKFDSIQIPVEYVVAKDDEDFPEQCRGMKLGSSINLVLKAGSHEPIHQELRELGLLPQQDMELAAKFTAKQTKEALVWFRAKHGHLHVPENYVMPIVANEHSEQKDTEIIPFPEDAAGMPLGRVLAAIRARRLFFGFREFQEWKSLGIRLDSCKRAITPHQVYEALEAYRNKYGNLDVPPRFEVPANDPFFPPSTVGMPLYRVKRDIVAKGHYRKDPFLRKKFAEFGIIPEAADNKLLQYKTKHIEMAINIYRERYQTTVIPRDFVIPSDESATSDGYHSTMLGAPLGEIVAAILDKRLFIKPKRLAALNLK